MKSMYRRVFWEIKNNVEYTKDYDLLKKRIYDYLVNNGFVALTGSEALISKLFFDLISQTEGNPLVGNQF